MFDRYRKSRLLRTVALHDAQALSGVNMQTRARRLFVALAAAAAASASTCTAAAETLPPYPAPDAFLGERLYPNEEALAQRLAAVIDDTVRRQYRSGTARRDAHPKAHGCVRAEFHVDEKL